MGPPPLERSSDEASRRRARRERNNVATNDSRPASVGANLSYVADVRGGRILPFRRFSMTHASM